MGKSLSLTPVKRKAKDAWKSISTFRLSPTRRAKEAWRSLKNFRMSPTRRAKEAWGRIKHASSTLRRKIFRK